MEILPERVTWIALYSTVTSKGNPCLQPHSVFCSGYSACVVVTQYGNADVMLDVIRGIDTIRTGAHAFLWGLCKSVCFQVLML